MGRRADTGGLCEPREDQWGQVSVRVGRAAACVGRAREKVETLGSEGGSGWVGEASVEREGTSGHGLGVGCEHWL